MRVGVNLLWLRPGAVGGSETYTTRLLSSLAAEENRPEIELAVLPQFRSAHPHLDRAFGTTTPPLPLPNPAVRAAAESAWLDRFAANNQCDLLHHAGGSMPFVARTPGIVTIFDLHYLSAPETFSRLKLTYLSRVVPLAVSRARAVCTISEFVKGTIIDAFGVDPDRVSVVPPVCEAADQRVEAPTRPRPYFLYPAISYPHKNHDVLVHALGKVPDVDLVFTGAQWPEDGRLRSLAESQGVSDRVIQLGRVTAAELDGLYQHAIATVFPSRYEGFGMVALEAMARGCPVIAADATALPETVGDSAMLVAPDDRDGWAEAMLALMTDEALRARLVQAGPQRARQFSSETAARAQIQAYESSLRT